MAKRRNGKTRQNTQNIYQEQAILNLCMLIAVFYVEGCRDFEI